MEYMNRPWHVVDESDDRSGFCRLTIREEGTDRLIAELPEVQKESPHCGKKPGSLHWPRSWRLC